MTITYIAWAIWLILAYFVYKNAQSRKLKSPMNWAFMAFLFGPIGLLVYYVQIVKPNKKSV